MDSELLQRLNAEATRLGRSRDELIEDAVRRDLAGQMLASVFAAVDRRTPDDLDEQDLYALVYGEVDAARSAR